MFAINNKPCSVDDYHIVYDYNGADTLEFDLSTDDALFADCVEHAVITEESNRYRITKIDGNGDRIHVSAQLDTGDFYASVIFGYDNTSNTLDNTVADVLPSGWTFINSAGNTLYRTLRFDGTPADAMAACAKLYGVVLRYDCIHKTVTAYAPESYTLTAAFVTEELNLRSLQYYGDSTGLITRLEARGKDGLTFADINDGKTYVENHQYTQDVICGWWKDERYIDKQSLLAAATKKLAALSVPARSYECDVIDLKRVSDRQASSVDYDYQDLSLYKVVKLIDVKRGTQHAYQVVGVKDYPHYPEKNVITLSSAAPKLSAKLQELESEIPTADDLMLENLDVSDAVDAATAWITGTEGGNVFFRRNAAGQPTELIVIDTDGIGTAQHVWRWNLGGFGHSSTGYAGPYTTAITQDGQINANFITTGKFEVKNAQNGTTFSADADTGEVFINADNVTFGSHSVSDELGALSSAIQQNATNISSRVTNAQMQSAISQAADSIEASVSATVGADAEDYVDGRLGLYVAKSDNNQVVSMINASANDINITGSRISISSSKFTLAKDGTITATGGTIGGWTIGKNSYNQSVIKSSGSGAIELNANTNKISFGSSTIKCVGSDIVIAGGDSSGDGRIMVSNSPGGSYSCYIRVDGDTDFWDDVYVRGDLRVDGMLKIFEQPYFSEALSVSNGGTGAGNKTAARSNLGIHAGAISITPVANSYVDSGGITLPNPSNYAITVTPRGQTGYALVCSTYNMSGGFRIRVSAPHGWGGSSQTFDWIAVEKD